MQWVAGVLARFHLLAASGSRRGYDLEKTAFQSFDFASSNKVLISFHQS